MASVPADAPPHGRLMDYPVDVDAGDLFAHASPEVAAKWHAAADGLAALARESGLSAQELLARQSAELGMSFRMTGDSDERSWPMTPMPLIIGSGEWAQVERGLIQRARALEALVGDIYGPQRLLREGHLPAAVVSGSRYYARAMDGLAPRNGHYIHVYAVDLARGPRGQWRVLGDRLRLANGVGYALENRLALSRASGSLLSDIHARRLAGFFAALRAGIAADCQREAPRIALLTPGRFNQSYPEQAHLARYLGFPLVEGRDLTVIENKLYIRTISGPKRVDALWRWIDTKSLDPLAFDARSTIGVPDLFDTWAHSGLTMANWPGVEVAEAPAFAAFMPRLFPELIGEEPLLPNVATWWCGQPAEAEEVRSRLDQLVLTPAFGRAVEGLQGLGATAGASLTADQRAALLAAMERRPMDYCAQEIVHLSTTPALVGEAFEPRAFTLRAFVARGADGQWQVMPGGFARLSASGEIATTLMGEGDVSADVCVVDEAYDAAHTRTALSTTPPVRRGGGILAAQAADNLYWFGRYGERAEMTVRLIRAILGSGIEVDAGGGHPALRARLVSLLAQWGAIRFEDAELSPPEACRVALGESAMAGGVAALLATLRSVGLSLRDRFAPDFWRVASRPLPPLDNARPGALLRVARDLVERFSAMSGLQAEDMVRGPSWCFLDMGRRIERALSICRLVRQIGEGGEDAERLGLLLDIFDSQITYRSRYLAAPARAPVFDLLLLDPDNPRSLAYQVAALERHIAALPSLAEDGLPETPLREVRAILAPLASLTAEALDTTFLSAIETRLLALSDTIAARYFLQLERSAPAARASLLA